MEENMDSIKVTFTKNLNKINHNTTISMPIDNNVNIKTILNINSYIYDENVECGNGKAVISGKIGLKVLYIDTDNITNTISDSQNFSETFVDNSITSDSNINILNSSIATNILSSEGTLKVNCDISISPIMYINLPIKNNLNISDNMIVKKSETNTTTIINNVDTKFDYTTNFETKDNISKILSYNSYFSASHVEAYDDMAMVEGKLYSSLLYETIDNDETVIREIKDCFNLKTDINIPNIDKDCTLDLLFSIDHSNESINTDHEDDNSVIMVTHKIRAVGVALRDITIDVIDDMFMTDNEIELNHSNREYYKIATRECISDNVKNEITLQDNESAIDQVLANLNITPEITNSYVKDNNLTIEGIITSHMAYIDENKEYKHKQVELPFIINTKIHALEIHSSHIEINVEDCKYRVKRGTIIELEYLVNINVCLYEKETHEMVDSINIGKAIDYSQYDYQIYIAKPNETMWELCKRIRISMDDIKKYNNNLGDIMTGGEKIIIKR